MRTGVIYCVDDEPDILQLYEDILLADGHAVELFPDGGTALNRIASRHPDLILLDERMNNLSGMAVCARLRGDTRLPFIPIIMVTGVDSKEGKIASLEGGIDDYILKPFDPDELLARVRVMLRIKGLYETLRRTREDLVKAEKTAVFGKLAAAMAHEIRNPLSIIGASIQYLLRRLEPDGEVRGTMETVVRKVAEIDGTIRELLATARPLRIKPGRADLNRCVDGAAAFVRDKCRAQHIRVVMDLSPDVPWISGDEELLQRAALNLMLHAMHDLPQGGDIVLTTKADPVAGTVRLGVKDTGPGYTPEDLGQIFEPFSGKRPGGAGLGLYLVRMIVEEHNGVVRIDSEIGKGSERFMIFPALEEKTA